MEIQNFKMRVTPEQSRIVQQTLFNNECQWQDSSKQVTLLTRPCLFLRNAQLSWASAEDYEEKDLPELTFQEFFDRYVKWCVKDCVEVSEWASKHFGCYAYVSTDKYLCVLESYINYSFCDSSEKKLSDYVELTFEQFEKYVLKSKDMEKVIGYKFKKEYESYLKAYCAIVGIMPEVASIIDYKETGYVFQSKSIAYDRIKKAGVLDLWFEPVYESKELYFGKVKFTIHEGYADTEYGKVTKEEISKVFDYISDAPGLVNGKHKLVMPIHDYSKIKFGCQEGTVKELEDIYKAM